MKGLIAVACAWFSVSAFAERNDFILYPTEIEIARTWLGERLQRQYVEVSRCDRIDRFRVTAIQLAVENADANIERVQVTYGNGERDELVFRDNFRAGSHSGWKDLAGGNRCIAQIMFVGRSLERRPAEIRVLARQEVLEPQYPVLGETGLSDNRVDYKAVEVSSCRGRDTVTTERLRLSAEGGSARVYRVIIRYCAGPDQMIQLNDDVSDRRSSDWFYPTERRRPIQAIIILGRTTSHSRPRVLIEADGLR